MRFLVWVSCATFLNCRAEARPTGIKPLHVGRRLRRKSGFADTFI